MTSAITMLEGQSCVQAVMGKPQDRNRNEVGAWFVPEMLGCAVFFLGEVVHIRKVNFQFVAPSPPSSGSLWRHHPLQGLAACCFEGSVAKHCSRHMAAQASGFACSLWRTHDIASSAFGDRTRAAPRRLCNVALCRLLLPVSVAENNTRVTHDHESL